MFDVSQGEARSRDGGRVGADSACSWPSIWWLRVGIMGVSYRWERKAVTSEQKMILNIWICYALLAVTVPEATPIELLGEVQLKNDCALNGIFQ